MHCVHIVIDILHAVTRGVVGFAQANISADLALVPAVNISVIIGPNMGYISAETHARQNFASARCTCAHQSPSSSPPSSPTPSSVDCAPGAAAPTFHLSPTWPTRAFALRSDGMLPQSTVSECKSMFQLAFCNELQWACECVGEHSEPGKISNCRH